MKAVILKLGMWMSIITMILSTASLVESYNINWWAYIVIMIVCVCVFCFNFWYYVAKGVEKG